MLVVGLRCYCSFLPRFRRNPCSFRLLLYDFMLLLCIVQLMKMHFANNNKRLKCLHETTGIKAQLVMRQQSLFHSTNYNQQHSTNFKMSLPTSTSPPPAAEVTTPDENLQLGPENLQQQQNSTSIQNRPNSAKLKSNDDNNPASKEQQRPWILRNLLLILTVTSVILGLLIGCVGRLLEPNAETILIISFPGEMLMRMLKLVILPLIASSMITSLAQLDIRHAGRMGGLSVAYYLATTVIAIVTGIVLVETIGPGKIENKDLKAKPAGGSHFVDNILDLIRNIVPDNLVVATMATAKTTALKLDVMLNATGPGDTFATLVNGTLTKVEVNAQPGMNVIGVIVVCISFGAMLGQLGVRAKTMIDFCAILEEVSMRFVTMMMWYSPVGITSMIAAKILSSSNLILMLTNLGKFSITVVAGLAFHGIVVIPAIYFLLTRQNPFKFMRGLAPAMLFAFGCSSSSATLPVNFRCLEELGIDRRVTRFVLPVGATINMDGTALYEAVTIIFIAQREGSSLGIDRLIQLSLAATMGSIGAAAIPGGGIVQIVLILQVMGLPTSDIALILTIDWLMDRFRTMINVMGDAFGAGIVNHYIKDRLPPLPTPKMEPPPPPMTAEQEAPPEAVSLTIEEADEDRELEREQKQRQHEAAMDRPGPRKSF